MKKLSIKAFYLILIGLAVALVWRAVDLAMYKDIDLDLSQLQELIGEDRIESFKSMIFKMAIVSAIIFALICAYFIYRLIKNKKESQKQGYITFLYVINIVFAVFNLISLIMQNPLALISLAINALIIVGCAIQRKYNPPVVEVQQNPDVFSDY